MMDSICFKGRLTAPYPYKKVKAPPPTSNKLVSNFVITCAEEKFPLHCKQKMGSLCLVPEALYHFIIKQKASRLR